MRGASGRGGRTRPREGVTYDADMRLLVNQGHRPDEYVEVRELALAARARALTALRFCGCEEVC